MDSTGQRGRWSAHTARRKQAVANLFEDNMPLADLNSFNKSTGQTAGATRLTSRCPAPHKRYERVETGHAESELLFHA